MNEVSKPTSLTELASLAKLIRYYILVSTSAAGSGHMTSSLSAVELAATMFFNYLKFDSKKPRDLANDHFILSKGHASPLYYALYGASGLISETEIRTLRKFKSPLEGHPAIRFPYTEVPTGSLGQGLSVGTGMALALRAKLSTINYQLSTMPRVFVLLGDGEMAEGQVWEAVQLASYYKLNNLTAVIDVNRLGQSEQTMYGHDPHAFARRLSGFGWRTYVLEDGHDLELVDKAYSMAISQAEASDKPAAIIAKTVKGKGVSFIEDKDGWHGVALKPDELDKALKELGDVDKNIRGIMQKPVLLHQDHQQYIQEPTQKEAFTKYGTNEKTPTRKAYGTGLIRIGKRYPNVIVLDADMKNSTFAKLFADRFPDRFFEAFIAEQNLVSMAVGLAHLGFQPFISTFGAFWTRAFDQFRMADLCGCNLVVSGSHGGVSIGEDGPSQMGLQDLALFRTLENSTVLYPSDAVSTEKLVELAYNRFGITYIRTTRPETPILYNESEQFVVGGSKIHYSSSDERKRGVEKLSKESSQFGTSNVPCSNNRITIIATGITVFEALRAQEQLIKTGITADVIDCYSIKPIDAAAIQSAARTSEAIITVEDHYPVGGLGDAVLEVLAKERVVPLYKLAVYKTPRSGTTEELLDYEDISTRAIVEKAKEVLGFAEA